MKLINHSCAGGFAAALFLLAASVSAQPPANETDVPDKFRLEVGAFRIGADSELTLGVSGSPRPPVDFEELAVPDITTKFYIEGFWRPWRRHQFSLSFYRNARDGESRTVEREITWGDRVITVGSTATGTVASNYLSGVYRFAAFKNASFEIGPSIGIGYLSMEGGIRGQASVSVPGGQLGFETFNVSKSLGQPTGDIGGYLYWWPLRRLLVRGDFRYIIVKPENSEASIADGRAAVVYHPWRNIGIGLQYYYTKFRYDRDIFSSELGGALRYSGGQVVLSGAF